MYEVEVIENFNLKDYKKLKSVKRADKEHKKEEFDGKYFVGDVLRCNKKMFLYLKGENKLGKNFIKTLAEIETSRNKSGKKVEIKKPISK